MYFGGGGNTTNTHYDAYENLMLVVDGTKQVAATPPRIPQPLSTASLHGLLTPRARACRSCSSSRPPRRTIYT
jgi:hypothetical protein